MLDRTIPYYNLLMRCDEVATEKWTLPYDHRIRFYEPGDAPNWARVERAVGDFPDKVQAQVEAYFLGRYDLEALSRRCLFAVNSEGSAVGTCTAWRDPKGLEDVASLHWLAVEPGSQGRGIGRALVDETMRLFERLGEMPVYLHTQPWSHKAIGLYLDVGFYALKTESFGDYENQFEDAARTLRAHLDARTYEKLMDTAR